MSTLLARASRAEGAESATGVDARPHWQAALIAVAWSVGSVLVPLQLLVLLGWVVADTEAGPGDALAVGAYGWLVGHGVPIPLAGGTLSLHPLGIALVVLALLFRAGAWAARVTAVADLRPAVGLAAMIALAYGAVVAAVAAVTMGAVGPDSVAMAAAAGVLIGLLGSVGGVLHGSGLATRLRARAPVDLRVALDAGLGATLVLLAGGALVLAVSLVVHGPRAVGLTGSLGAGFSGWPLLLALNLLLLPNAVVYAAAYAVGPGFALGVGTSVSLGGTDLGPLPGLTLLAALPEGTSTAGYAYGVLLVPLLAGVTAGLVAVVRAPGSRAELAAVRAMYAGLLAGVFVGVLSWFASGSLGGGRLAVMGVTPWLVAGVVALQIGVVGAVTAWLGCPRPARVGEERGADRAAAGVPSSPSRVEAETAQQLLLEGCVALTLGNVRVGAARAVPVGRDLRPEHHQDARQDGGQRGTDAAQDDREHTHPLTPPSGDGGLSGLDADDDRDHVEDDADREEQEREHQSDERVEDSQPAEPASAREVRGVDRR